LAKTVNKPHRQHPNQHLGNREDNVTRQQQTAQIVATKLAAHGVTTHHQNGLELINVNGQLAVEVVWPDRVQVNIKRYWQGHRPPLEMHYGGYRLRSRNELEIAALLDVHKVQWRYEPKQVLLPNGQRYLPDFLLLEHPEELPDIIEVKDATKVKALAQSLGMPPWADSDDLSSYTVGPVTVEINRLDNDIRKPHLLAQQQNSDVWVVPGKTGPNQPYVIFKPDGTAHASRQCPLFQNTSKRDEAHYIANAFTAWPRPGTSLWSGEEVADIIIDFLTTEGWVNT
jgi:hypothetical protein